MSEHTGNEREERLLMAAKIGTLLCLTVVIATLSLNTPSVDEAMLLAPVASTGQSDDNATAKPDVRAEAKPYYFPSEYELHAPEPGDPVPTF